MITLKYRNMALFANCSVIYKGILSYVNEIIEQTHGYIFRIALHDRGPFTRYVKLRVAHAPGMPGMLSPPRVSDSDMHNGSCVPCAVLHAGIAK